MQLRCGLQANRVTRSLISGYAWVDATVILWEGVCKPNPFPCAAILQRKEAVLKSVCRYFIYFTGIIEILCKYFPAQRHLVQAATVLVGMREVL